MTKTGFVYVLQDAEKPVLDKLKEARTLFNSVAAMSNEKGVYQQLAERGKELEEQRGELQEQWNMLNQQVMAQQASGVGAGGGAGGYGSGGGFGGLGGIGGPGSIGTFGQNNTPSPMMVQREQVRQMLLQVTSEQQTVRNQTPQRKDNQALDNRVKKAQDGFKSALAELRTQVDAVQKQYTDLDADADVKKSLLDAKKVNPKNKLGPSDPFNTAVRELEKAERTFLDKRPASSAASKKKAATAKAKR